MKKLVLIAIFFLVSVFSFSQTKHEVELNSLPVNPAYSFNCDVHFNCAKIAKYDAEKDTFYIKSVHQYVESKVYNIKFDGISEVIITDDDNDTYKFKYFYISRFYEKDYNKYVIYCSMTDGYYKPSYIIYTKGNLLRDKKIALIDYIIVI